MFKDPIVEEVRAARQRHALRFNNDLDAIVADLQQKERQLDRPVVTFTPKIPFKKAV